MTQRTTGRMSASPRSRRSGANSLLVLVLGASLAWLAFPPVARAQMPEQGFGDLVERVSHAVVNISTSRNVTGARPDMPMPEFPPGSPFEDFFRDFFERQQEGGPGPVIPDQCRATSLGSGFVIDPAGFVVTNNHVVGDADRIEVVFDDDRAYDARLIGRDPKTDLALLKIEGDEPFQAVEFADSDDLRVGDWIIAIGNPFGFGQSVTAGIVSARGRDIRSGPYDDFIQVDAPINRGNSGGPSFNLDGDVVGVNTAIFSPSGGNVGIGFAIPANLARPVIDSLMRFGTVKRGWLGVRIQTVTEEIARSLGLPDTEGALVANLTPGGPAERSTIQPGDVILSFNGRKVGRMRSLPRIVAETEIEKEVDVVLWRDRAERRVRVTVGELPEDEELAALTTEPSETNLGMTQRLDDLGLTVAQLSEDLRRLYEIQPEAQGVVVTDVVGEGPAATEDVRPGDLIVEVGQVQVASPPEFMARIEEAKSQNKRSVLLLVDRQGDLRFVALRFG